MKFSCLASAVLIAAVVPQSAQAEVYAACFYQDGNGKYPFTQLFTLDDNALKDGYGEYTRDKTAAWEKEFAKQPHEVRQIGSFYSYNFVGQFSKFARDEKGQEGSCWMTTDKAHAFGWYRKRLSEGKWDKFPLESWQPSKGTVLKSEPWPPM
jgi:hypothetical protein